jgi:hydroxylysine kinase
VAAAPNSRLRELLAAPAPQLPCDEAERIAGEHFGVSGTATPLASERDQNFRIVTPEGRSFVLKIANPLEDREATDFQTRALLRIAASDPQIPVPRVIITKVGATQATIDLAGGKQSIVRLLTYLPGVPLADVASTPRLRARLGVCLARIDKALRGFTHPGADHELLWNMTHAEDLIGLVGHLPDAGQQAVVTRYIEHFAGHVRPLLAGLRSQVIYNDLSPGNVLIDPNDGKRLVGVIDFGDMVRAPLVVDVAIAAAYQLRHTPDPFDAAGQLIGGFHSETPLDEREVELLFDLIATRLASAMIITGWRASLHPDNRRYILRNAISNWNMLRRLDGMSRADVQNRLKAACHSSRP